MAILCLAFATRVCVVLFLPSVAHPDETFQLLEQAHRLAFGYGVKPWEFEAGLRSYVTPYFLAALFQVSTPIFGGPRGYIDFTRIVLATLSLAPVFAIYRMGERTSRVHALFAGLVGATWFEIVFFAVRPLTEALACDAVFVALAVASRPLEQISRRQFVAVGFCLGLAVMLRLQFLPGTAFVGFWLARFEFRKRWTPLALGALPVLLTFGAVDWLTWGYPFRSFIQAILLNLVYHKSRYYLTFPIYWSVTREYYIWLSAMPIILALVCMRARKSIPWIGFAVIVIATHALIPHKEYRFTYPAYCALVVVAAMGAADLARRAREHLGGGAGRLLIGGVAALWVATSAVLAAAPNFAPYWFESRGLILGSYWVAKRPSLCGLMVYDDPWQLTGGYAYLHRDIPIYALARRHAQARRSTAAYNFILLHRASTPDFQSTYDVAKCFGGGAAADVCVMERAGACRRLPGLVPLLDQTGLGAPWLNPLGDDPPAVAPQTRRAAARANPAMAMGAKHSPTVSNGATM